MKRIFIIIATALTLMKVVSAAPELVMQPGMKITAETRMGVITIAADSDLKRTYTWEGASRSATLQPRTERWYGSLGAYNPGMGDMWVDHNGITRGVLQEGQQHFKSEQEATEWLRNQCAVYATVFRDDGLVVSFDKFPERRQINVEVWQILINGSKPKKLQGSSNNKINTTD